MAGTKTEYPALLAALQPGQAVSILNTRIKQIEKINEDVSEWLAERRKIEEAYVAGLNRLAARRYDSGSALGVFQTPWQGIISGAIALSEAHSNFASRILSDVETPLKEQRRDLQSMASLQSNLASMAKDVEKAAKKSGSSAENAKSQWESQAPYVFEQLQTLDENRVNQMREALTQLQTHEIDCHERGKTSAETGLNALLNVDTPEEVSAFVARTSSEIPPSSVVAPDTPRPETSNRSRVQTSRSEREVTGNLAPPERQVSEDRRSEASVHSEDAPKEKKSRLSGLRRLGTVMTRRKDKERLDEKPAEKSAEKSAKSKRKNPLRRNSTTNNPIPSPNASLPDIPSNMLTRRASGQEDRPEPVREEPSMNGPPASVDTGDLYEADDPPAAFTAPPATNGQLTAGAVPQIGVRPPSTIVEESTVSSALADMERAQAEANAQEPESAFNLSIRDKPIQEESSDQQQAAMNNVSNTLRASIQPPPARRSGTLRGRRDVRNTVFVPSATEVPSTVTPVLGVLPSVSPVLAAAPSPIIPSESRPADAQSIRSVSSSLAPGAVKHPEMTNPGLNASIVETSSATFESGNVTKAVVVGELAFVHNGAIAGPAAPHVRLDNFPVLEKVAPNPAFVSEIPFRSGEYNLDISKLNSTAVGFKYQVHLNETQLASYAPLLLTPQHQFKPNQASVILNYTLNPAFAAPLGTGSTISLQNVVIMLTLEGARATSCQSKPPGVFSREKSLIYWKLDDLTLSAGNTAGKLLARFITEGEAKTTSVEARWELKGAGSGLGVSVLGADGAAGSSDPFADARTSSTSLTNATEVPVVRKLVGGRYTAS